MRGARVFGWAFSAAAGMWVGSTDAPKVFRVVFKGFANEVNDTLTNSRHTADTAPLPTAIPANNPQPPNSAPDFTRP